MILVTGISQSPILFSNHELYCIRLVRLFFKSRLLQNPTLFFHIFLQILKFLLGYCIITYKVLI